MVVREMVWQSAPPSSTTLQSGGKNDANLTSNMTEVPSTSQDVAAESALDPTPVKRHLDWLDQEMTRILNSNLPPDEKLHQYLLALRSSLLFSEKMNRFDQQPVPVVIYSKNDENMDETNISETQHLSPLRKQHHEHLLTIPDNDDEQEQKQQQQNGEKNLEEEQNLVRRVFNLPIFSKDKILNTFQPNYRSYAEDVLDALANYHDFKYDVNDGSISIGKRKVAAKSNINELLHAYVKEKHGQEIAGKPPVSYSTFKSYMEKKSMLSPRKTRSVLKKGERMAATDLRTKLTNIASTSRSIRKKPKLVGEGAWLRY